jgi:hypothetical protein
VKKLISVEIAAVVDLAIFAGQAPCSIDNIRIVPECPAPSDIIAITLSGNRGNNCIPCD